MVAEAEVWNMTQSHSAVQADLRDTAKEVVQVYLIRFVACTTAILHHQTDSPSPR